MTSLYLYHYKEARKRKCAVSRRNTSDLSHRILSLGITLLFMICILGVTVSSGMTAADTLAKNPVGLTYRLVIVQEGDTLWNLVGRSGLDIDHQTLIAQTLAYNQLGGVYLTPGQRLYIPSAD